jgi:hypothetical protein
MGIWVFSDSNVRAMYAGGRAGAPARRLSQLWAAAFGLGLMPKRWVTLEVAGRRSGRIVRFRREWPIGAPVVPRAYARRAVQLGSGTCAPLMGGPLCGADAVAVRLVEVPVIERPLIIKRYLGKVPGARPHIPVDRHAPVADFEAISSRYPVFQVAPVPPPRTAHQQHARTVTDTD